MNERKFTKMFYAHADQIYRYAFFRLNDEDIAKDITSTVFTKAWASRDKLHSQPVEAWLFAIAKNTLIDHYRKKSSLTIEDEELPSLNESLGEKLDKEFASEKLSIAMKMLPNELREIVTLRFLERLRVSEVANILGMSEANVRVKQHRALKKLRSLYEA